MEMSSTVLVPKNGDMAPKVMKQERMDSFSASSKYQKRVTSSDSRHEQFDDKRKCTISSQISAQDVKPTSERASSNMHFKQPTGKPSSVRVEIDMVSSNCHSIYLIKLKSDQSLNDLPPLTSI